MGWRKPSDYIQAYQFINPSGVGTITIAAGKMFTDGTNVYDSNTDQSTLGNLTNVTLRPCTAMTVNMNANGIRTYASNAPIDFTGIDGLTAYIVSDFDGTNGTLTLTSVGAVPAGTGLLLKGTAGDFEIPVVASASAPAQNYLVGVTDGETIVTQTTATNTNFILANGSYGIDWYTLQYNGPIGANKAYLSLPTASLTSLASGFIWVYDDGNSETTEVNSIENGTLKIENGVFYDLAGQRVAQPTQKGLYIHNGKKVVIK